MPQKVKGKVGLAVVIAMSLGTFGLGMLFAGQSAVAGQPAAQPTGSAAPAPMPADKTAAVGNNLDDIAPDGDHVVLSEQMKVSSPQDLIINVSSECAILTQLVTGSDGTDNTGQADTSGQVDIYVTIDGKTVPVAQSDPSNPGSGDNGSVVFCNNARGRKVTDMESPNDGQDRIADYNSARQANAFQWLAINTGTAYDDSVIKNGNNILQIDVHALYTDVDGAQACTPDFSQTCSEALIGKRTLIVEPTHASVVESTGTGAGGQ